MAAVLFFEDKKCSVFQGETLLSALRRNGIPLAASCGGKNRCGACKIRLLSGSFLHNGKYLEIKEGTPVEANACALHQLSAVAAASFPLKAASSASGQQLLPFLPPDTVLSQGTFAAIDLGSTNIAGALISEGRICRSAELPNRQSRFGSNIIDRIAFASTPERFQQVREALIKESVLPLLALLVVPGTSLSKITVAGNTAMSCFFFGIDPAPLGEAPFELGKVDFKGTAKSLGLDFLSPEIPVNGVPHLCSFIGGDALAGLTVSDFGSPDSCELYMDIGTNCEMILNKQGRFFALSAAAGPAFEQGGTEYNALKHLSFDGKKWHREPDGLNPSGLRGTALVDLLSESHRGGFLDDFAKWITLPELPSHLLPSNEVLAELLTAKAAVASGLELLLKRADVHEDELSNVYLAGNFASHLDIPNARYLDLLPHIPDECFIKTGNSALIGAAAWGGSKELEKKAAFLRKNICHINPADDSDGMSFFALAMRINKEKRQ